MTFELPSDQFKSLLSGYLYQGFYSNDKGFKQIYRWYPFESNHSVSIKNHFCEQILFCIIHQVAIVFFYHLFVSNLTLTIL